MILLVWIPQVCLAGTVKITEAYQQSESGELSNKILFIETEDKEFRNYVAKELWNSDVANLYVQSNRSKNKNSGPMAVQYNSLSSPRKSKNSRMGTFLLGTGFCLGGCLFVTIAGETKGPYDPPPEGFYATVGSKSVEGPGACLVGGMWLTGLIFMGKAAFGDFSHSNSELEEKNSPNSNSPSEIADQKNDTPFYSTSDEVIRDGKLIKGDEFQLELDSENYEEALQIILDYSISTT